MATAYNGKILLNPVSSAGIGVRFFSIDKIIINQEQWSYDESTETYYFIMRNYTQPKVLRIYNPETNSDVLADCMITETNTLYSVRISSISDDPLALEIMYRANTEVDETNDTDTFFPITKSNLVRFDDGETLEMKYRNGDLSNNALDPVFREKKYTKKISDSDFVENHNTYVLTIKGSEHGLGTGAFVSRILEVDTNGQLTVRTDIDISMNDSASEGTKIILTTNEPFSGYVIIEKEDLP